MFSTIVFIVVLLHIAAGFGYLMYKLSPSKKGEHLNDDTAK